jgi:formylglycine-generating enzyme required for sulfatase activity
MAPIQGGKFLMGSPESEAKRKADEGPQREVTVAPFWMGVTEVTWDLYRLFMFSQLSGDAETGDGVVDAISRPTKPYVEMSFGMGIEGYPAISMTQHAAQKLTEWLSARTGHFYRLPTEAEWEYACRAGTTTAYSFGDDPALLKDYAWSIDNADFQYKKVGQKKPNPWGLFDMHGNVSEWTLDRYTPKGYEAGAADNPWVKPTTLYPRTARGGSWFDDADRLRCAARLGSDEQWKMQDPQLPKSIWYLTDAQFLGLRVVRPVEVPSADEMYEYWNSGLANE